MGRNLRDRPFATALSLLLVSASITALLHLNLAADALARLVPEWLLIALSICYGIAGVVLLIGLATRRGDCEAAGCALAASGIVIRATAIVTVLGISVSTAATVVFYAAFLWAVLERLRQILRHEQIVRVGAVLRLQIEDEHDVG